nr:hypothetical protein Iba_chr03bCG18760 [Ipomoea batatas]
MLLNLINFWHIWSLHPMSWRRICLMKMRISHMHGFANITGMYVVMTQMI